MNKILAATGQDIIDSTLNKFNGYEVVGSVNARDELFDKIDKYNPDIIVIGEGLYGKESLFKYITKIVRANPDLRVVYLAGYVDLKDESQANKLVLLVMSGVYDIVHDKKMTAQMLKDLLDNPRTEKDMEYLTDISETSRRKGKDAMVDFHVPEEFKDVDDSGVLQNVVTVSSIKPGTGKSFLSVNIASAIAAFGENNGEGQKPKVAIIEADLQNLSIGTLLGIEGHKKNLKAVMDKIATIITPEGQFTGNRKQLQEVDEFILNSMLPYSNLKNLSALVGSELAYSEIGGIQKSYYAYLIAIVAQHYDVVIVDTNSSLMHVTTLPLMSAAKICYYLLNLDYNNVKNNIRYKEELVNMGIDTKVKYILNQNVVEENKGENLLFTSDYLEEKAGFKLEAKIPDMPSSVFLNRVYSGTPLVLDTKAETLSARKEILKLANQVYPIKDFEEIMKKKK